MKPGIFLWAFVATVSAFSSAHAAAPACYSVDARAFDIAEVKLGMTYGQALTTVTNHFQISPDKLKVRCGANPVTRTRLPRVFSYDADGKHLTVYLKVRIPADAAQELTTSDLVVSEIQYRLDAEDMDRAALKEAVLTKYGDQFHTDSEDGLHWCTERQIGQCAPQEAELTFRETVLDLKDPSYEEAIKRYREDAAMRGETL